MIMVIIKFRRDVVELLLDVIPSSAVMLHFSALAFIRGPSPK
jgi:hypothetical protein